MLVGYGADAINPYLAFEALCQARKEGRLDAQEFSSDERVLRAYRVGVAKGILKVMAKMGISTLQSYKGAQIFEAVGLNDDVIERCFAGTPSRIQGVNLETLATEAIRRHASGYPESSEDRFPVLPNPGEFHWRAGGETHVWDPDSIANLQVAARAGDRDAYRRFADHVNAEAARRCTLRGLLCFQRPAGSAAGSAGRSGIGRQHRPPVLHRGDELRFDFARGTRDAGRGHESGRRSQQHGGRGRRSGAILPACPTATRNVRPSSKSRPDALA